MAFNFVDSCDNYSVTADLLFKWIAAGANWTVNPSGGRFGGGCITITGTGTLQSPIGLSVVGGSPTQCYGFWFKASAPPAAQAALLQSINTGATNTGTMGLTTAGGIYMAGANGVTPIFSDALNVCDNAWHWIEAQFGWGAPNSILYIDGALRQNSTSEGSFGNVNYFNLFGLAGITVAIDDLVFYDNSNAALPTVANYPLGSRQIVVIRPANDSAVTFATTSSGSTHFNLVNETHPDGDATYVEDATSGHKDLLGFASLPFAPTIINAVVVNVVCKNPSGGTITAKLCCKSNVTETDSATALTVPTNYGTLQTSFPLDPNTSAAWTATAVNAAKFGYMNV